MEVADAREHTPGLHSLVCRSWEGRAAFGAFDTTNSVSGKEALLSLTGKEISGYSPFLNRREL